ncbi:MAG TPA: DUF802 domain-containing protein [Burkholderiaceae bacterium]
MNRSLHHAAFAVGLLAVGWVGTGYVPGNPLALALVLLIGAFYLMGALELHRFQRATAGLANALAATNEPPPALAAWLAPLPPSLQHTVRLRVEGERVALPGPALTPYLAGLLVLLGMLGTFLGMVVTLKGTGLALENASDLEAIRASLAAPVKGLGLAFGTSVAGVAASAMLGLMSALARRERARTAQQLDARIATTLRHFSQAHQREQSLRLLQAQAEATPALVTQLQALVAQMDRQSQALQDRLVANQAQFHGEAQRAYAGLAESVDRSLKTSLADSARLAGAAIEPAVQATMAGLARENAALREALAAAVQQQLAGVTTRLDATLATLAERWQTGMADQQRTLTAHTREALSDAMAGFEQHTAALLHRVTDTHATWDAAAAAREQERMSAFHDGMATMAATLARTSQTIAAQAEAHARATIAEIERLMQTAAAAPRAAAEVIAELRTALSDSLARDNTALDERNRLLGTLGSLLDAVNHASTEQRAAIDALVQATTEVLDRAGARFAETVASESRTLQAVSAQVTGSAAEVASLGEGFGVAVQLFSSASEQLTAQLQRIETALGHSMARSDEQLAYYVAQAREIVDLTLGSQKQIVEDLQQLAQAPAPASRAAVAALEADPA